MKEKRGFRLPPTPPNYNIDIQEFANNLDAFKTLAIKIATNYNMPELIDKSVPKTARLNIPLPESKDQRWFIEYKVYSEEIKKFITKKDYSINKEKDLIKRKSIAEKKIEKINLLLKLGMVAKPIVNEEEERLKEFQKVADNISIQDCLNYGLKVKLSRNYRQIKATERYVRFFIDWLKLNRRNHYKAKSLSYHTIHDYIHYLTTERKLSNRTVNNYILSVSSVMNEAVKLKIITENPFIEIKTLSVGIGRNHAFNSKQKIELLEFMDMKAQRWESFKWIKLFCQFMYYTLARTQEISSLQVKSIGLHRSDQIYLDQDHSKNIYERHIAIPPQLQKLIDEYDLKSLDPEFYIFSYGFQPGPEFIKSKNMGRDFRRRVLDPLNYPMDYTLYSWKHTGVCDLYRSGVSKAAIQMQLGHRGTEAFDVYLKSLGLFENKEIMNSYPDITKEV